MPAEPTHISTKTRIKVVGFFASTMYNPIIMLAINTIVVRNNDNKYMNRNVIAVFPLSSPVVAPNACPRACINEAATYDPLKYIIPIPNNEKRNKTISARYHFLFFDSIICCVPIDRCCKFRWLFLSFFGQETPNF